MYFSTYRNMSRRCDGLLQLSKLLYAAYCCVSKVSRRQLIEKQLVEMMSLTLLNSQLLIERQLIKKSDN